MTGERQVAARFSAAAKTYDRHAAVQWRVAARVAELAGAGPEPRRILEVGVGTGGLTERLCARWPGTPIVALDVSARMIEVARARLAGRASIDWVRGDLRAVVGLEDCDLAVGSSSLHWIVPIRAAFARLRKLLLPGGRIVFGLMLAGTLRELHESRRIVAPRKRPPHALPTEEEALAGLRAAGFRATHRERRRLVDRHESAKAVLHRLHEQGLTGGPFASATAPLNRGELEALAQAYEARHRETDGSVPATYEVLYLAAERAAP